MDPGFRRGDTEVVETARLIKPGHALMADKSFLAWPFFDARHSELARRVDDWAGRNLGAIDHGNIDAACRALVAALGRDGWLTLTAVDPADPASKLDVRSLCIMRETLARHDGLA